MAHKSHPNLTAKSLLQRSAAYHYPEPSYCCMYMASLGRHDQVTETSSAMGSEALGRAAMESTPGLPSELEDNGSSDAAGVGDMEVENEKLNNDSEAAPATDIPKSSPVLGMTESEIRSQQAALANEYAQIARVFSHAAEKRVSLTLKRLERLEKKPGAEADKAIQFERPMLTKLGKLLSYQVSSIQMNTRSEALNIWRDFYKQKKDLREKMGSTKQKRLAQLQQDYRRSAVARNTDISVLDWISANLDIVHYLRTQKPLSGLEAEDVKLDISLMRKRPNGILDILDTQTGEFDVTNNDGADESSEESSTEKELLPIPDPIRIVDEKNNGLAQLSAAIGSPELKRRKIPRESSTHKAALKWTQEARDVSEISQGNSETPVASTASQHSGNLAPTFILSEPHGHPAPVEQIKGPHVVRLSPRSGHTESPKTLSSPNRHQKVSPSHHSTVVPHPGQMPLQIRPGHPIHQAPSRPSQSQLSQPIAHSQPHQHSTVTNGQGSPPHQYTTNILPATQAVMPEMAPPEMLRPPTSLQGAHSQNMAPQAMAPQALLPGGYSYYPGYQSVPGYPQFQYPAQPANLPLQHAQGSQGYVYGYQNWQQFQTQGAPPFANPWQGQYAVWPPHPQ